MIPDTDKNRNYYQRMYNQIHASDEFKERLIHMKTNTEQSPIQMPYSTQTSVSFTDKPPASYFLFVIRRCLEHQSSVLVNLLQHLHGGSAAHV